MGMKMEHLRRARIVDDGSWCGVAVAAAAAEKKNIFVTKKKSQFLINQAKGACKWSE